MTLLLSPPSAETWLDLINSEFYFGILTAVILLSDARRPRWPRCLALSVCVLSGPLTTFLAPVFVARYLWQRKLDQGVQAAIVCAGALVQVAVGLTTRTSNRQIHLQPLTIGPVLFNKQVVLLFLDPKVAGRVARVFQSKLHFSLIVLVGTWVLFLLSMGELFYLLRARRSGCLMLLVAIYFVILEDSLALGGGLRHVPPSAGGRYASTPNVLIEVALTIVAFSAVRVSRQSLVRVLLVLAFVSGGVEYLSFHDHVQPWPMQAQCWQANPSTTL